MTKIRMASISDVASGKSKLCMVNGQPIALFNVDGNFHAIYDKCTHRGASLSQGQVSGKTVTCPFHGAEFDITTGQNLSPPAPSPARYFKVFQEGNELFIDI